METVAAPCDMMNLFERAFNPQLCKEIGERAEENTSTLTTIFVAGVMHTVKGSSICYAQVLKMARRDWCGPTYRVFYREDINRDEPMKELKVGCTIRITNNMAFTIQRADEDETFATLEAQFAERRAARRKHGV